MKKLGLVGGMSWVSTVDYYRFIPAKQEARDLIQNTLRDELGKGIILEETKKEYLAIIDELIRDGAEGIILGCTEKPAIQLGKAGFLLGLILHCIRRRHQFCL